MNVCKIDNTEISLTLFIFQYCRNIYAGSDSRHSLQAFTHPYAEIYKDNMQFAEPFSNRNPFLCRHGDYTQAEGAAGVLARETETLHFSRHVFLGVVWNRILLAARPGVCVIDWRDKVLNLVWEKQGVCSPLGTKITRRQIMGMGIVAASCSGDNANC